MQVEDYQYNYIAVLHQPHYPDKVLMGLYQQEGSMSSAILNHLQCPCCYKGLPNGLIMTIRATARIKENLVRTTISNSTIKSLIMK